MIFFLLEGNVTQKNDQTTDRNIEVLKNEQIKNPDVEKEISQNSTLKKIQKTQDLFTCLVSRNMYQANILSNIPASSK